MAKNLNKSGLGIEWSERVVPVADLVPFEKNPRTISKTQFRKLVASLHDMGYHQRIITQPDLAVIGGHQRIAALKELKIEKIAVLVPSRELTADEFRQVLVQDNLAFGDWEMEGLAELYDRAELLGWGFDENSLVGFNSDADAGRIDPDAVPALQEKAVSKLGQIWACGQHRIGCGSSTDGKFVAKVLAKHTPIVMVTDPPYGVDYDPQWRAQRGLTDKAAGSELANDDRADWSEAYLLFPGPVAYVWHAGLKTEQVFRSLEDVNFHIRAQIIWVKTRAQISRGAYHWQHEPAFMAVKEGEDDHWRFGGDHEVAAYAVKDAQTANWQGGRKQTTVWFIDQAKLEHGHATQKPVMCMQRPILNHTAAGDGCYDPFLGSGTTLIAAEQIGRRCFGIELEPRYIDVAVKRWQAFTGLEATDAETGKLFNELMATA